MNDDRAYLSIFYRVLLFALLKRCRNISIGTDVRRSTNPGLISKHTSVRRYRARYENSFIFARVPPRRTRARNTRSVAREINYAPWRLRTNNKRSGPAMTVDFWTVRYSCDVFTVKHRAATFQTGKTLNSFATSEIAVSRTRYSENNFSVSITGCTRTYQFLRLGRISLATGTRLSTIYEFLETRKQY